MALAFRPRIAITTDYSIFIIQVEYVLDVYAVKGNSSLYSPSEMALESTIIYFCAKCIGRLFSLVLMA